MVNKTILTPVLGDHVGLGIWWSRNIQTGEQETDNER